MSLNPISILASPSSVDRSARLDSLAFLLKRLCPVWLQRAVRPLRPYFYHLFLLGLIPTALFLDVHTQNVMQQDILGVGAFLILFVSTRFSSKQERRQVWIMVGVATCIEVWSSIVWGIYRYRFGNVPLFVPWGHGLIYLFALRAARTPLMLNHGLAARRLALTAATVWALGGLSLEPMFLHRLDLTGALFWPIFVWFMRKPSAPIFAAAFFVTSILEIFGTGFGNWTWQVYAPISHIPTGNPPSVISGGYCLMDLISIQIAASLPALSLSLVLAGMRSRCLQTAYSLWPPARRRLRLAEGSN
jgi:hypothetical protein